MPYPRFVAFNAPAATLWAGGFIALGIAAGRSWQLVNRWAGRATLVLLLILVFAVGVVLFARWLSGRRDYVLDRWRAFLDDSTVKQLRDRFRPQLDFVRRRLDPAQRFGLYFTVGLLFAASAGLAFGALLDSLREGGDAAEVDRAVLEFFNSHRAEALDDVMRFLGRFGRVPLLGSATGLVGVAVSVSTRKLRWLLFTALAIFGTMLLDDLVSIALRAMPFTAERGSEVHDGRFQAIRRRRRPDSSARSCTRLGAGAAGVSPSGSEPPVSWARS